MLSKKPAESSNNPEKNPNQTPSAKSGSSPLSSESLPITSNERRKGPKTRITIRYDIGFGNLVYLRGKGANLSWERGILLRNVKSDEWIWETDIPFTTCEFKVLINDKIYELGDNHTLNCGTSIQYTPKFS